MKTFRELFLPRFHKLHTAEPGYLLRPDALHTYDFFELSAKMVEAAVDDLDRKAMMHAMGIESLSASDVLLLKMLAQCAGIDTNKLDTLQKSIT